MSSSGRSAYFLLNSFLKPVVLAVENFCEVIGVLLVTSDQ
jgi:hypothetical protein